jgi:hypothetical protein
MSASARGRSQIGRRGRDQSSDIGRPSGADSEREPHRTAAFRGATVEVGSREKSASRIGARRWVSADPARAVVHGELAGPRRRRGQAGRVCGSLKRLTLVDRSCGSREGEIL